MTPWELNSWVWLGMLLLMAGLGLVQIWFGFAAGAFLTGVGEGLALAGYIRAVTAPKGHYPY